MGSPIPVVDARRGRRMTAAAIALVFLLTTLASGAAAAWGAGGAGPSALDASTPAPAFAPEPMSLSNGAAQNFTPYAPSPFTSGSVSIGPNVDGVNIANLPSINISQAGNLTVGFNGSWNPAPANQPDRDWVLVVIVRNGVPQAVALEANTTVRVALNASQLPVNVYFGLPSTTPDVGQTSTARVVALPPGGNLTVFNLTSANAGMSLAGNAALPSLPTESVWFNASGSYPGSGVLSGSQTMVVFVPSDGGVPIEVHTGRVLQWTNSSHFPGGRFLALRGAAVVVVGGNFRATVWTRGSPESTLFVNATVAPTFAVRPDTLAMSGTVGNRTAEATTAWNMTGTSVLAQFNYNSVICNQVIRIDNGTYRMFCSWQDNSGGGTSGIDSAWSPDGKTWTKEAGTRYSLCSSKYQINQIAIVRLLNGTLRMYYGGQDVLLGCSALGSSTHISVASSTNDGVTWSSDVDNLSIGGFAGNNPDAMAVAPTVNGTLRLYFDSSLGVSTALSDDGLTWNFEATIGGTAPREVYALTSGGFKMYYGTATIQSRLSGNGLNWSAAVTEVPQFGQGNIEPAGVLDRGDGNPIMLAYSPNTGLYVGFINGGPVAGARVDVGGRLSDGTVFGLNTTNAGARGQFQVNGSVPAPSPLGRYQFVASAGFGENRFRGVVVNRMPQWAGPLNLTATEDVPLPINFTQNATDPDVADQLAVFAFSPYLNTTTNTLLYPDGVLADTVVGLVNDGHDNTPFSIAVTVIPVDDPPILTLQPSYNVTEGQLSFIDLGGAYSDEETAVPNLTLTTDIAGAVVAAPVIAVNFSVSGTYPANVSVSDGNHTVTGSTLIVVLPVNDAPVVNLNSSYQGDEGATITVDFSPFITDEDNALSSLTLTTNLTGATVSGLNITVEFGTPGSYPLMITVSDGNATVTATSVLVVHATNDAPTWTSPPPFVGMLEDVPYTVDLSLYATDEETPSNLLAFTVDSPHATVNGTRATFVWPEGVLNDTVTFTVSDGFLSARVTVNVTIAPVNDPPVLTNAPPASYNGTGPLVFQFNVSDPDDAGGFDFDLLTNASYITIDQSGRLTINPPAQHGTVSYSVRVSDASGATAGYVNYTFELPLNHLPTMSPTFAQLPAGARLNQLFSVNFTAVDLDNDTVRATLEGYDAAQTLTLTSTGANGWRLDWTPNYPGVHPEPFETSLTGTLVLNDSFGEARFPFVFLAASPPRVAPYISPALPVFQADKDRDFVIDLTPFMHDNDSLDTVDRLSWAVEAQGNASSFTSSDYNPITHVLTVHFFADGSSSYKLTLSDPAHLTAVAFVTVQTTAAVPGPSSQPGFPWWIILVIAAGAGAVGAVVWRARARAAADLAPEAAAPPPPPQAAPAARPPPVMAAVPGKRAFLVEDVFVLYRDGRTIFSRTGIAADAVDDPESVGAMLIAVQDFVKDSFRKDSPVDRMGYGDNVILLERGEHCMLAVTVFGEPDREFRELLSETAKNLEASYAGVIESWSGNKADFVGVEAIVAPIWQLTAHLTRGDVLLATTAREVQMLSGVEFFQGFVRLKVGVVNNTATVITNVTVDLDFNQDVLRLHKIEPAGYKAAGAKVSLGVLHSGEKATLAYYFDPQICTQSMIDGTARYKDAEGTQHVVQMKSRKAEVVCPLFFTKEQANTAMLRRLVETQLNQFDVRAYSVAQGAEPKDLSALFEAMKATVLAHDVQSVRSHEKHNPYVAEGWFYGKTQVKGYQMIIRAVVDGEKGRAEFFVASTVMRSVTGLLAELNHQFQEVVESRFGTLDIQSLFDEEARNEYADPKAVSKMIEGEAAAGENDGP